MSSPLDRDFGSDQLSPYAPKWVREAAHAARRGLAPKFPEGIGDGAPEPTATPAPSDRRLAIEGNRLPRSLEPTLMPEPYPVSPSRSGLGVLARFAVAIVIVAILALLLIGKISTPWTVIAKDHKEDAPSLENARAAEHLEPAVPQLNLGQQDPRTSGEAYPLGASLTGAAEGASVVIDGLANGSTLTTGQSLGADTWRIPASDLHSVLVQPPPGYVGRMDIMVELRLADDKVLDRKPLRLEWSAAAPPPSHAATPSPTDLRHVFEQFVEDYTASTGQRTFSANEREMLFSKFQQFLDSQVSRPSVR